ncbi:hypothetical protein CSA37_02545 [Candidatus Fermentibacteria bacterium]|nr:MAG: hypothetical protein CSA37_02545 [Candidatus Fermentibacteria bacterium]
MGKTPGHLFITGGSVSSPGREIAAASIALLLKQRGYSVFLQKFDPCLNVDYGTIPPYQHGEVYVTDDGSLMEVLERQSHPWFMAVQFHPVFKSRPLEPHPLFAAFAEAAFKGKKL